MLSIIIGVFIYTTITNAVCNDLNIEDKADVSLESK